VRNTTVLQETLFIHAFFGEGIVHMIRINRQTDYAFRVILSLAKQSPQTRISSAKIRKEMLIPPALSLRIVAELARGGFIHTFPGRDGGIELAYQAKDISLWSIVDLFEGPIHLSECQTDKEDCPFEPECPIHRRWEPLQEILRKELEKITFDELAQDTKDFALLDVV
jgi:Rrf2 family nitric oxide-sensitive transcriptional repressor